MTFAATVDPMRAANRLGGRKYYEWRIISVDGQPIVTTSDTAIQADGSIKDRTSQDVTLVLSSFNAEKHCTAAVRRYIRTASRTSKLVCGFDTGAAVLALADLLDGKSATTHWEDLENFAARFPAVDVRPDRFVISGPVVTCGGALSVLDFMLTMIGSRQGEIAALNVASLFTYDRDRRQSDMQRIVSLGSVDRREPRVSRAIRVMESHIDMPISISAIALRQKTSRRTLEYLFKKTVGMTPASFYTSLRLQAARRLIIDTKLSLADTAERTGFPSISCLSRSYKSHFGYPPSAERR
ncbi:helix-turn-helix domain-containing protein (plasmid) [Ensifer adhaerens]|nr:helix-turn-helix domain-containing protein [Ensifer adhaerens]MBZ7927143.1 helix-turn-helix domain-containing protein [Ensifer adhaerens]